MFPHRMAAIQILLGVQRQLDKMQRKRKQRAALLYQRPTPRSRLRSSDWPFEAHARENYVTMSKFPGSPVRISYSLLTIWL